MHKKKAGKLQTGSTGSTIPKQYWLAVNGKPINIDRTLNKWCRVNIMFYIWFIVYVFYLTGGSGPSVFCLLETLHREP